MCTGLRELSQESLDWYVNFQPLKHSHSMQMVKSTVTRHSNMELFDLRAGLTENC